MKRLTNQRVDVLNILRFIATMSVFLQHGRTYISEIAAIKVPCFWLSSTPAWAGVWIFLFLSGYVIEITFLNGKYNLYTESGGEERTSIRQILKWYCRRFLRIAPPYYIYCIMFEIFSGKAFFWNNPLAFMRILTFTYNGTGGVSGIGHLWYVSLAMQLYLIMPLLHIFIKNIPEKFLLPLYFVVFIVGLVLRNIFHMAGCDWYSSIYTAWYANIDLVFCGMLTSAINYNYKAKDKVCVRPSIKAIAVICFIFLFLYNCYIYHYANSIFIFIYRFILPSIYILSCSFLIFCFHPPLNMKTDCNHHKLSGLLQRWFTLFSKYSYCFYIVHILVFEYASVSLGSSYLYMECSNLEKYFIFFIFSFAITMLLSILVTNMCEVTSFKSPWQNGHGKIKTKR